MKIRGKKRPRWVYLNEKGELVWQQREPPAGSEFVVRRWEVEPCKSFVIKLLLEAALLGMDDREWLANATALDIADPDIERWCKEAGLVTTFLGEEHAVWPDNPRQGPIGAGLTLWEALVSCQRKIHGTSIRGMRKVGDDDESA
jgi:hypothetical protein